MGIALDPTQQMGSRAEHVLRSIATQPFGRLTNAIGDALKQVTVSGPLGWFTNIECTTQITHNAI